MLLRCTLYWDLFMILVISPELMTWLYIEVYAIFRCDILCWDILCMSSWWIIRRRDVYFLTIYYNCVIYRFNRNRALHYSSPDNPPLNETPRPHHQSWAIILKIKQLPPPLNLRSTERTPKKPKTKLEQKNWLPISNQ